MTVAVTRYSHTGVRVIDAAQAIAFYEKLGFSVTYRDASEPVIIMSTPTGVELNLIVNAASDFDGQNVLMDVPIKRPGWTHVALSVASLDRAVEALRQAGIPLSGGPVRLGPGTSAFVRDPDRNVIELRQEDD